MANLEADIAQLKNDLQTVKADVAKVKHDLANVQTVTGGSDVSQGGGPAPVASPGGLLGQGPVTGHGSTVNIDGTPVTVVIAVLPVVKLPHGDTGSHPVSEAIHRLGEGVVAPGPVTGHGNVAQGGGPPPVPPVR